MRQSQRFYWCLLVLCSIWACAPSDKEATSVNQPIPNFEPPQDALFELLDSTQSGIDFLNQVTDGKDFNVINYRNYYNGGGVAVGDVNNDGLLDVFFTSNLNANRLYLNKGSLRFELADDAVVAGSRAWSTGVTMADVNADGWLDIYVCNSGDIAGDDRENELFINNQDGTFTEQAENFGLNDLGFSTHAAFFDYDGDGDLDCYVLNNSFKDPSRIRISKDTRNQPDELGGDKLYRNEDGQFVNVTQQAGLYSSAIGFGLGVVIADVNQDLLPDIFVSNDFWERDYLYLNQGDGTFSEDLRTRTAMISGSSMGADIADLTNDGAPEVFTTDMLPADNYRLKAMTVFDPFHFRDLKAREEYHHQYTQNTLHLNKGMGEFVEISGLAGVSATDWSWGSLLFDFENDGYKDIYVSNGIYHDITYLDFVDFIADRENIDRIVKEKGRVDFRDFLAHLPSTPIANYAFENQQNLRMKNKAHALGLAYPSFSNGATYADLDNDGDLDLLVNNVNMPAMLFKNRTDTLRDHNYVKFMFSGGASNPFGIGAKVTLYAGGKLFSAQNFTNRGFQSSTAPEVVIGVGSITQLDSAVIEWPDGSVQVLNQIETNRTHQVNRADASKKAFSAVSTESVIVEVSDQLLRRKQSHRENPYSDFDFQRLMVKTMATESSRILTADVNGDGRDDVLHLSSNGDEDKLYIHGKKGLSLIPGLFSADKEFESTCGAFLDIDRDGDQDLIIGSGGNHHDHPSPPVRFYENQGIGNFSPKGNVPDLSGSFGAIKAHESGEESFVFFGGRAIQGQYGKVPRSYLLKISGGAWTDVSPAYLANCGMVTDATWADVDSDGDADLVVVGEWMAVTILENNEGKFDPMTLPGTRGWWNAIVPADLDGDGDTDFVLGNWGENTVLKASAERPLKLHVKDFDNNSQVDPILTAYAPKDSVDYPFATKADLTRQLPYLKKRILKYDQYARMTFETLFTDKEKLGVLSHQAETLSNSVLWNNDGVLSLEPLPAMAQISPVYAIVVDDFDADGYQDIWMAGNLHDLAPQLGRQGASKGVMLRGNGARGFNYVKEAESGFYLSGEVRDAEKLEIQGEVHYVVSAVDQPIRIFKKN
ncbi:VCBS repeat-containing protein [Marinoscillum furvescens]|uniref:VCBS repeat protein n=1 Tax=Marinoscillum furvescens DSM 4134 TaxID=1122208 RepID=A0A3D9L5I5_MARFU|nr:VCBS repeat-containing protein [Marinoscillum furvescens]RED99801.1 VCBS repeat protein [Marinoscillum furvescens DSM 4134]